MKVNIFDLPKHDELEVLLAIAEDDLVTDVKRGENKGRKLSHVSVVREFVKLGKVLADKDNFEIDGDLALKANWKKESLKLIVFAQSSQTKEVFAIGVAKFN